MTLTTQAADEWMNASRALLKGMALPKVEIALLIFVSIYIVVAFTVTPLAYVMLASFYLSKALVIALSGSLIYFGVKAMIWHRAAPTQYILTILRERGRRAGSIILLFGLGLGAFTALKIQIPNFVNFYADPTFANWDAKLHGTDPWRLAHTLPLPAFFDHLMVTIYSPLWFLQWFGTFFVVAGWQNRALQQRYLWAFALSIAICGTVLATAMSSVGPLFYDQHIGGQRFAELIATLSNSDALNSTVLGTAEFLYTAYQNDTAAYGAGISAMPSVHVAMSTLNAWFLYSVNRWLGAAGFVFAAIIQFGSVYTGFHYALDGYVSIIVVTAIWFATRHFMSPSPKPAIKPGQALL